MRKLFKTIWDTFTDKEGEIELIRIIGTLAGLMFTYLFIKAEIIGKAFSPEMLAAVLRILEFVIVGVVGRAAITPARNIVNDAINTARGKKKTPKSDDLPESGLPESDLPVVGENVLFKIASRYVGTKELKGHESNPTILSWAKALGWHEYYKYTSDSIPWCSVFATYCCLEAKLSTIGLTPAANSFLNVGSKYEIGDPLPAKNYGIVAVYRRGGGNHVQVVREPNETFEAIGGNEGDEVKMSLNSVNSTNFIEFRVIT